MKFSRSTFFEGMRPLSRQPKAGALVQSQVDGLNALLGFIEDDPAIIYLRWAAYMLATVKHECADTWQPIEEYGKGAGRPYGQPAGPYQRIYYGRGYVQLTWFTNYEKMATALNIPALAANPELALQPATAYKIMSYGMRAGSFTGYSLSRWINYRSARRIINGLDQWERIKKYAEEIEAVLRRAVL